MKVIVIQTVNVVVALYVALTIAHHLFHQMLTAVNHQVHQVILYESLLILKEKKLETNSSRKLQHVLNTINQN